MRKIVRNVIMLLVCLCMFFPHLVYGSSMENVDLQSAILQTAESLQKVAGHTGKHLLKDREYIAAGSSHSDWIAMTLALSGTEDAYEVYRKRLKKHVIEKYEQEGCLDAYKATEYHRIALTMLSLGEEPQNIENAGNVIDLIADGTYNFHGDSLDLQGANGVIYALLTLDAKHYEIPENAKFTREDMRITLLKYQCADGGFALMGNISGDVGITAMALQALAPYREDEEILLSIERALNWLSKQRMENAESTAQTILALCALGIDIETDERFTKNGQSLLGELNRFRMKNGMYMHDESSGEENIVATFQSLLAMEALYAQRTQGTWIFDFAEYQLQIKENYWQKGIWAAGILLTGLLAVKAAFIIRKRTTDKKGEKNARNH